MPILPLFGHAAIWQRLDSVASRGSLPASLLLAGPAGVGKQRLALQLAQRLLCSGSPAPCGTCEQCRFAASLTHPDLHWRFPRPRLGDDVSPEDVAADYAEVIAERVEAHGLYPAASGLEGIHMATVKAIVRDAALKPAMAARKVIVVGDADRMVQQAGSDASANAFLKLLEEPPANTNIILTSSKPGALLPTIRSRVVPVRVGRVDQASVRAFVEHDAVRAYLDTLGLPKDTDVRAREANGAPGSLLGFAERDSARERARRMLEAVTGGQYADVIQTAMSQSSKGARGSFSEALDAMTGLLSLRLRDAVDRGDDRGAVNITRAVDAVERARMHSAGNANPQLVTFTLLSELGAALR